MSNIGDATGTFAKRVGNTSADLARRAVDSTVDVAKRIGPKRAIGGLVLAGIVIGGTIILVRYLRSRSAANEDEGEFATDEVADEATVGAAQHQRRANKNKRKHTKHASV